MMSNTRIAAGLSPLAFAGLMLGSVSHATAGEGDKPKPSSVQREAHGALQVRSFNVNAINCIVSNRGMFARDPITGNSGLEFPKGSGKYAVYAAGLWMGGYVGGDLRVTAAEYAHDYRGGPYGTQNDADTKYGVVKLSQRTVDLLSDDDPLNDSQANQAEAADYDLWLRYPTAPTEMRNGRPVPKLTGDQTVYTVYHDGGDPDTEDLSKKVFASRPLHIEVRQSVFGYAASGGLGNIMFIRYQIYNRGTQPIDSAFVALWSDPDVGFASDDLVGVDVNRQLGYANNGRNNDSEYGADVPAVGYDFLQGPRVATGNPADTVIAFGRTYVGYKPQRISAFSGNVNGGTYIRDPATVKEAYNFLNGFTQDGAPIDRQAPTSRYLYAGDPVTGTGSLDGKLDPAGDRRLLLAAGPFTLAVGDSQEVVTAVVIGSGTGSVLRNITTMRANADAIRSQQLVAVADRPTGQPAAFRLIGAAPNPFNPTTAVRYQLSAVGPVKLEAFDALGRNVRTLVDETKPVGQYTATFDGSGLPSGVYLLRLVAGGQTQTVRAVLLR